MYQPDIENDPDRRQLINLLAMLPGPDDVDFWNNIGRNGPTEQQPPADHTTVKPDLDGYLLGKFNIGIRRLLAQPAEGHSIAYFCQYLLSYFDGDRPTLWTYLTSRLHHGDFTDRAGERFARDLSDTAWRLIVRYGEPADALASKWPAPNSATR